MINFIIAFSPILFFALHVSLCVIIFLLLNGIILRDLARFNSH